MLESLSLEMFPERKPLSLPMFRISEELFQAHWRNGVVRFVPKRVSLRTAVNRKMVVNDDKTTSFFQLF